MSWIAAICRCCCLPRRRIWRPSRGHQVEIVASLPYYRAAQTDAQRGEHIRSPLALQLLNSLGYGREGSGLIVNLVPQSVGAFLPAKQEAIEAQFRKDSAPNVAWGQPTLYHHQHAGHGRFLEF